MSAIDNLVASGRDPLEILFVPLANDVEQWIADDINRVLDKRIADEISVWPVELRVRLRELIESRAAHHCVEPTGAISVLPKRPS